MATYGFNADPYVSESESRDVREKLGLGQAAGTGGITYRPTGVNANRPTSTTQTGTQTGTQESTTTVSFTGERPAEFAQPEWNEGEIKKAAREIAGPKIRQLRQALQQALVKHYENPNVRKMMVRSALQGYGIGLGNVTTASRQAARAEYAQKYSFDMQAAMANFNAAWQEYMGAKKTATTGTSTGVTSGTTNYVYQYGSSEPAYTGPAVFSPSVSNRRSSNVSYGPMYSTFG